MCQQKCSVGNPPKIIDILPEGQSTSLLATASKGKVPHSGSSKMKVSASPSTQGKGPSSSSDTGKNVPSSSNNLPPLPSTSWKSLPAEAPAAVDSVVGGKPEAAKSILPSNASKSEVPHSYSSKKNMSTSSFSKRKLPSVPTEGKATISSSNTGREPACSTNNLLSLLYTSRKSLPDSEADTPSHTAAVESPADGEPDTVQSCPPTAAVESSGPTVTVNVSDSPAKPDENMWLEKFELYVRGRVILESSDNWLNDNIVCAAQFLLCQQSKGKIVGWQHTQCAKTGFKALPAKSAFIQILHVSSCHWILVSNVNPRDGGGFLRSVGIYDSNRMMSVSKALKNEICSFVKPTCDIYTFDIMNIQTQTNSSDCGLFAIACATELVDGQDPVVCNWDQTMMRSHLIKCLTEGKMVRFPCTKRRRIPFGQRVRKSENKKL